MRDRNPCPSFIKRRKLDCGYRLDIVVSNSIILELKCCEKIEPIYEAQLLTYLKLSGLHLGLILNFNVTMMRNGIKRIVHEFRRIGEDASFCFPPSQGKAKTSLCGLCVFAVKQS